MLRAVMIVVGLLFVAAVLPTIGGIRDPAHSDTGDTMQMSLYATLGVFLLLGARNPPAHRSLINFAAWSSFAHAVTMSLLGFKIPDLRAGFIGGSIVLVLIGAALLALRPGAPEGRASQLT
jgi:uncharacterized protein DUF6632